MTVNVTTLGGRFLGPGDLNTLPEKTEVIIRGTYDPNRDSGTWAPMIGLAVLNGVTVRWDDDPKPE